jgi:tetratricopeptide (TPR) repeat protein
MRPDILIFCDGGLGNRINALASGLAVARYLGLTYCVHWPINNWCAAPFQKIFANKLNVSTESISQLRGMLDDAVMLLHDEVASNALGVKFDSAYRFKNLQDFGQVAQDKNKTIFFYPAVIPNWIPEELVHKELKFLKFDPYIVREVKEFISKTMPGPFYGLHLRRTDLNVGLDDLEVFNLAKSHPEATFFVCSDDPAAEQLAAGHQNVFRREKKYQIERKTGTADWLSATYDDDGRLYYGNIQRNDDAVVEGAVDMLILAHSTIVGYSGSTFQKNANLLGRISPLLQIERPPEMFYLSKQDIDRSVIAKEFDSEIIIRLASQMMASQNGSQARYLMEKSMAYLMDKDGIDLFNILAIQNLNEKNYLQAIFSFEYLISLQPDNAVAYLKLAYTYYCVGKIDLFVSNMSKFNELQYDYSNDGEDLINIINFLNDKFNVEVKQ